MGGCMTKNPFVQGDISQDECRLLVLLSDDLLTLILSFCATAPLPDMVHQSLKVDRSRIHRISTWAMPLTFMYHRGEATLTHELPLVCQRFREICYTSDWLWIDALAKALFAENWNLKGLLEEWDCEALLVSLASADQPMGNNHQEAAVSTSGEVNKQNLRLLCRELSAPDRNVGRPETMSPARYLYEKLWDRATLTLPAFFLRTDYVPLAEEMRLHLFEPRYRLMVSELTQGRPASELDGETLLSRPFPKMMFVALGVGPEPEAYVSLVKRCRIDPQGTADVAIVPIHFRNIVSSVLRPDSEGLYDVTVSSGAFVRNRR